VADVLVGICVVNEPESTERCGRQVNRAPCDGAGTARPRALFALFGDAT
jgi:hypothetical protein